VTQSQAKIVNKRLKSRFFGYLFMSFSVYLKAALLFALLTAFLLLVGFIVGYYVLGAPILSVLVFMLAISVIMNAVSYFYGPKMILTLSGARLVSPNELPRVYSILEEVSRSAGIPTPKLGVSNQPQPNAFTTGRSKKDSVVVVTSGLLKVMDENELRGVLAHEVGHIVHRDVAIATLASTLATAITYMADIVFFSLLFGGGSRREGNGAAGLFAVIFAPFAASMVQLALSRSREYYADEESAKLTQRPDYLVSALRKIEEYIRRGVPLNAPSSTSALWISNPFRGAMSDLFSTHPATEKRIKRLIELSRKMGYYF
jgi:heat shock protein HtpX